MLIFGIPLLTAVTFSPLLGVLFLFFVQSEKVGLAKMIALISSIITFLLTLPLYLYFNPQNPGYQFVVNQDWISQFAIRFHLGLDGISLFLVLLTSFLSIIATLGTWNAIEKHTKEFLICLLLLEVGMLGVFLAVDGFLFYIFWEVMLIPMYLLIGVWGGDERLYASIKFFIYTMAGSVLMLVAIIYLALDYKATFGVLSFNIAEWKFLHADFNVQLLLFGAFAIAFAIKVPMFPFHTWLPDAHVQAPTAGSVILAGVLLKMGTYGFVRFAIPIFPDIAKIAAPYLMTLAVIGIIYGGLVAMVQPDMKKLVAYSSVSHLGFVMLGIFSLNMQGLQGGMIQMLNHGVSTGGLFLGVGMLYERRHTKYIKEFGGLVKVMPRFSLAFMILTLSSIGLPGLNGFVGEFMILVGAFKANPVLAVFAVSGVIIAAMYMLRMYQKVFMGTVDNPKNEALQDLTLREGVVLLPLIFLIVYMGVYPNPFFNYMESSLALVLKGF